MLSASRKLSAFGLLAGLALLWVGTLARSARSQDDGPDLQGLEEQALTQAVQRVAPSVLRIETFGGLERVGKVLVGSGPTTGLAVAEDGYVLSSAFNFIQKPTSILVTLPSGKRAAAEVVARDQSRMLVLLKVKTEEKLVVPKWVARDQMAVGQWNVAVGRTFSAETPNISIGVLSAVNRIWGKAIQTDAKVSPSNYGGPLIDIRGQVLGILVPLSPQGQGEVAGAEWYDSGIGFAVPLSDVMRHLDTLKSGEDLKPGLLGVSLKGTDIYADPVVIAACPAKSPAHEAGLRAGDEIIKANGKPVVRQAQLRHVLGGLYAGDKVKVVAKREDKELEFEATLVDQLIPYEHPFLGILPRREPGQEQVAIRYVYPDSPAAAAGLQAGDVLESLGEQKLTSAVAWRDALARFEPEQVVQITRLRDGASEQVEVTLGRLPTAIPAELPPARDAQVDADKQRPAVGVIEIKIPEEQNECVAYVPENYDPDVGYGLIVLLHSPGTFDKDKMVEQWKATCEKHDLILLAPQPANANRWSPTEVDYVGKAIDDLAGNYHLDESRAVAMGYKAGGAMAFLVGFAQRERIRAIVAVDASVPRRARPPATDPIQRLALFFATPAKSPQAPAVQQAAEQLKKLKYPVTLQELQGSDGNLSDTELQDLSRWLDALDRI